MALRDRYARGQVSQHAMRAATGKLEARLDRMLERRRRNRANQRLARYLEHERLWLFRFLHCFGLEATNNAAERAIRGMVIARKVWGGNRTWEGARTHQTLASVLRTCWQQGKDAIPRLVRLMRAPRTEEDSEPHGDQEQDKAEEPPEAPKRRSRRQPLARNVIRERIVHDLSEAKKQLRLLR